MSYIYRGVKDMEKLEKKTKDITAVKGLIKNLYIQNYLA
jgi:hypothetical protein